MKTETYTRSFAGGEVTPEFFGRLDDIKFQTGLALCENFVVKPHGPVENRAGFRLVREVKDSAQRVRLIPFVYNDEQTMVLEMGAGYVRFHTQAATVLDGGAPYEIATPYTEGDLFKLRYTQSADVLTLTTRAHPPAEIRRLDVLSWEYTPIDFAPALPPPTGLTAVLIETGPPSIEPQFDVYVYAVTTIAPSGAESQISAEASVTGDIFYQNNYVQLTWNPVPGAVRYRVYKQAAGLFGVIGETTNTAFNDNRISPDTGRTAPTLRNPFLGAGNYPQAVAYHEGRRWFASTDNLPQTVWATKSGTETDLNFSVPFQDSDSVQFRVAAREAASVQHMLPLDDLILLTRSGEWRVRGANSDIITPANVSVKVRSYVGANDAQPAVVNAVALFAAARGGHVWQLGFSEERGGYVPLDLSLRAPHLFDLLQIVDIAYAKSPVPIVWMVSSNGNLLGLTYIPEEQVWAWHQHTTQGAFESICVVAEGEYDALYAVIRRDGRRFVERMEPRDFAAPEDAFFVDSGLTYDGPATNVVTGLGHLEGREVAILADGTVHPRRTVVNGTILLDRAYSKVHVGLPYIAKMRTLPVSVEVAGYGQGRVKNVNRMWLKLFESSGVFAGPAEDALVELKQRTNEPYGSPARYVTGEVELVLPGSWSDDGSVVVLQRDPLPCTVLAVTKEVSFGGG